MKGPREEPTEKTAKMIPMKFPRSRSGTKSQTIMSIIILTPPSPMPCTARPPISMAVDVAPPLTPLPSAKIATAVIIGHRRPKILASWPKRGCTAVLQDQALSTLIPCTRYCMEARCLTSLRIAHWQTTRTVPESPGLERWSEARWR